MIDLDQLPQYRSHKVVRAAPIVSLGGVVGQSADQELVELDVAGIVLPFSIPAAVFARSRPDIGDYIVVYDDGYVSHSPKKAFEEGYTRL